MPIPNLPACSIEELRQFANAATPEEIESSMSKMSEEQISAAIIQINEDRDPKWKEKTRSAILGLNKRAQLEAAGKALSAMQIIELIDHTLQIEDKHHWKLSPLLVGMPHETFSKILELASQQHLHLFQHEGVTEPVQHQLTTLSHKMASQIEEIEKDIDAFDEAIGNMNLEETCREDILEMFHQIELYAAFFQRMFHKTNKALAIAWNTRRPDLIESLNKVKDSCQKYAVYGIGMPRGESTSPTGLYAKLEERLFGIFGDPKDPRDPEALRDEEPAQEALVKFSVWYLRDYWEMGLLPNIKEIKDLDLDLETHTENERANYREGLFFQARKNLEKIGLATVKDLKKAYIFSKKTLREYIQQKIVAAS